MKLQIITVLSFILALHSSVQATKTNLRSESSSATAKTKEGEQTTATAAFSCPAGSKSYEPQQGANFACDSKRYPAGSQCFKCSYCAETETEPVQQVPVTLTCRVGQICVPTAGTCSWSNTPVPAKIDLEASSTTAETVKTSATTTAKVSATATTKATVAKTSATSTAKKTSATTTAKKTTKTSKNTLWPTTAYDSTIRTTSEQASDKEEEQTTATAAFSCPAGSKSYDPQQGANFACDSKRYPAGSQCFKCSYCAETETEPVQQVPVTLTCRVGQICVPTAGTCSWSNTPVPAKISETTSVTEAATATVAKTSATATAAKASVTATATKTSTTATTGATTASATQTESEQASDKEGEQTTATAAFSCPAGSKSYNPQQGANFACDSKRYPAGSQCFKCSYCAETETEPVQQVPVTLTCRVGQICVPTAGTCSWSNTPVPAKLES